MENNNNSSIDPVKTGRFICELRKSHNLTQEELGNQLFITRKAVSKWETGKCCPSIDVLKNLGNVLGVTVEELINGEFKEPDIDDIENSKKLLNKMLKNKTIRNCIIIFILLIFSSLLIFFFENRNSTRVYTIYYEDENFAISNGTIVFSKAKEYIHLGNIENNLNDISDNTDFEFALYIKNNIDIETLLAYKSDTFAHFEKSGYSEIDMKSLERNLNNLYLKISYKNNEGQNKVYDLHLNTKLNYKNNDVYNFKNYDFMNSFFNSDDIFKKIENKSEDIPVEINDEDIKMINIDFLYKMSEDELKKTFHNKNINYDGEKYIINYPDTNLIEIKNSTYVFTIYLDLKKVIVKVQNKNEWSNLYYLNIIENEIIFESNNSEKYKILKFIFEKLNI